MIKILFICHGNICEQAQMRGRERILTHPHGKTRSTTITRLVQEIADTVRSAAVVAMEADRPNHGGLLEFFQKRRYLCGAMHGLSRSLSRMPW